MMSDAPAHHLFCLLGPVDVNTKSLPEVLCVIQVILVFKKKNESEPLHSGEVKLLS